MTIKNEMRLDALRKNFNAALELLETNLDSLVCFDREQNQNMHACFDENWIKMFEEYRKEFYELKKHTEKLFQNVSENLK